MPFEGEKGGTGNGGCQMPTSVEVLNGSSLYLALGNICRAQCTGGHRLFSKVHGQKHLQV